VEGEKVDDSWYGSESFGVFLIFGRLLSKEEFLFIVKVSPRTFGFF
jgi:hypothetical protein